MMRRILVGVCALAVAAALPATPPSRNADLLLASATDVRDAATALKLVRRHAAAIERQLKRRLEQIGHIYIALPYQTDDWREAQLPPSRVDFLFQHAGLVAWRPSPKLTLPADSKVIAAIAVPAVQAGARYRLVNGRVVVRTLEQEYERAEMRDSAGRILSRRVKTRRQPIYAEEVRLLVDRQGRVFY